MGFFFATTDFTLVDVDAMRTYECLFRLLVNRGTATRAWPE